MRAVSFDHGLASSRAYFGPTPAFTHLLNAASDAPTHGGGSGDWSFGRYSGVGVDPLQVDKPGRGPIFVDNDLAVAAAEHGSINALNVIRAGATHITPAQLTEFLNVSSPCQIATREAFLSAEGILVFEGTEADGIAQSALHRRVYRTVVAAGHSDADATLAAFAATAGWGILGGRGCALPLP